MHLWVYIILVLSIMLHAKPMCNSSSAGRSVLTSNALYDGYHHSRHLSLHPFGVPGLGGPCVVCLYRLYRKLVNIQTLVENARYLCSQEAFSPLSGATCTHGLVSALVLPMKRFDFVFWIFMIWPQGRQTRSNALAPPVRLTTRLTTADFGLQL